MCQVTIPHVTVTNTEISNNHDNNLDTQTISQQFKWFVTDTPSQVCIFYYSSTFLNKKDVFDYIFY